MATKNNPGEFDCYDKSLPDEPMFVLLARDPRAPQRVLDWVRIRGKDDAKAAEAVKCAEDMMAWKSANPAI